MGIDPSINSTGICINYDNKHFKYHILTNNKQLTKRLQNDIENNNIKDIKYHIVSKCIDDTSYNNKEKTKTQYINGLANELYHIIRRVKPDAINMEGISYNSVGSSLIDLAGLNYVFRKTAIDAGNEMQIISPKELKSKACGNANATKEEMVYLWLKCDKKMSKYTNIKIDDLADAFFLSKIQLEN